MIIIQKQVLHKKSKQPPHLMYDVMVQDAEDELMHYINVNQVCILFISNDTYSEINK